MKYLITTLLLLFSLSTFAGEDDHPMSKIIGDNIELSTMGHSIAGRIGNKLVFGDVSTAGGHKTSTIKIKVGNEMLTTNFTNNEGVWGGTISTAQKNVEVKFVELLRDIPAYIISVGEKEYTVRVEYDDFRNNHFINPSYILELDDSEVKVKMEKGQACWMYSLHLIFMIYGTYLF